MDTVGFICLNSLKHMPKDALQKVAISVLKYNYPLFFVHKSFLVLI